MRIGFSFLCQETKWGVEEKSVIRAENKNFPTHKWRKKKKKLLGFGEMDASKEVEREEFNGGKVWSIFYSSLSRERL